MSRLSQASVVCLTLLLASCANVSTDPREGGLMGGIKGLQTGAYDQRVQERQDRLSQMQALQSNLSAEQRQLEQDRTASQAALDEERRRLQQLNNNVVQLRQNVDQLVREQGTDDKKVQELQARVQTLQRNMQRQQSTLDALKGSGLGDSDMDLRRRQLEEQRDLLRREYDLLMKLSLDLAG
jgi:chromosome segregation ATPase